MKPRSYRRAGVRALLCSAALLLSACGLNRELARQADAVVAAERPSEVGCARADRCAIASPYHDLVERARAENRPDAPAHYVNVLEVGEDSLLLRVHLIRAARTSIDLQTFIWAGDDAGWLVLEELIAAARRGVKVRVLADQLFSLDNVDWLARLARAHVNLEFRLYNPTFDEAVTQPLEFAAGLVCCFSKFNQRMHNKLLLIDGEIGIAGGRNVENRYFDWDAEFDYRDRDVLVLGPVAGAEMRASFEQFWKHPRSAPLTRLNDVNRRLVAGAGEPLRFTPPENLDRPRVDALRARADDAEYVRAHFAQAALRVGRVDYFSDAPDKAQRPDDPAEAELTRRISDLLLSARSQIVFETPYLVLSQRAREVFRDIRRRKPPVPVIVSTNSLAATDAFYVYALSYKYKKRYLKRYGFQIHEFKPFPADAAEFVRNYEQLAGGGAAGKYQRYGRTPLKREGVRLGLHAKSIVIDDRVSLIGSHNFDPRSDNVNSESGFIIYDRAVAEQVRAAVLRNTQPQNAWVVAQRPPRGPKLIRKLNNVIATVSTALPLFDLWPFRYATSYELKPGCSPLPPRDPGFQACYEDVGDFPEVDLPLKTIYTRIVTAFGAGLVGIL
ncbi:phospholipase D family protein [Dokdonella sp.]|uniref:phospholipase D-like domain-containing protein n=1 Tax=Dokdonella sp. TaxID=2291710 RepID=UPI001B1B939D|nr:phospholipase D family protein [Dokdonella sp.]MBO9661305.1 phospholipase D family protein [Dokdonella sp.]